MAVDVQIGEAGSVRRMEQFGGLGEFDQDVGLLWSAPAKIPAFLGDGLVKRGDAAAGLLELRSQRLEGGAILLLQRCEGFQRFRQKRRARIGGGLLGQSVQRIVDLLSTIDGRDDHGRSVVGHDPSP